MARRKAGKGYGPRGTSYTEMKAKDFAKMLEDDLGEQVDAQLNGFIRSVVNDLTTQKISPVLTGFFASSWRAATFIPKRIDEREAYPKWARIKYSGNKLLPGYRPVIEQRWEVPVTFKRNQSIYIGNTTKYAPQALISDKSRVSAYLQGGAGTFGANLSQKIDRFFTDKRPDIRVGGSSTEIPNKNKDAPKERRINYTKS